MSSAAEGPEIEVISGADRLGTGGLHHDESADSIFRAPAFIRYGRESDFEPKWVSIGPYYNGRENLKPMEQLKRRCMSDLLKKRLVGGSNVDNVPVHLFMGSERNARHFYKEEFDHRDVDFIGMLILDSCFIIRIFLTFYEKVPIRMGFLDVNIKEVRSDLLLLENQIPLFFIIKVYGWLFPRSSNQNFPPFETVLQTFIRLDMPWRINNGDMSRQTEQAAHLLDLYWRCSSPSNINQQLNAVRKWGIQLEQPNLAQIHRSVPKEGLDVIFSNGIIWMPCLKIDSSQTTLLLNLVAFENSIEHDMRNFSTYVKLMDDLIDSEKDVELLQQCGVIYNTLSNHKMAATFFNDIGNFCLINKNDHLFSKLDRDVKKYYDSSWNRRYLSLKNNYFSSPWAVISVIAGALLLYLTSVQTFYTVYPNASRPRLPF